jgi:hypothetical protein
MKALLVSSHIAAFAAGIVLRNLIISNFKKGLRWLEDHIQ